MNKFNKFRHTYRNYFVALSFIVFGAYLGQVIPTITENWISIFPVVLVTTGFLLVAHSKGLLSKEK